MEAVAMNSLQVMKDLVLPGDCILDIGAHRGDVSQFLSGAIQGTGEIYSFECHPTHFLQVAKRAVDCQNIRPYCKAMSDRMGHAVFYFGAEARVDQASTLVPELANKQRLGDHISAVLVETDTVDRFCKRSALKPAFIKIDVEGAESLVFAGAKETVAKHRPALVFEHGVELRAPLPWHYHWLAELGYQLFVIDLYVFFGPVARGDRDLAPALLRFVPDDLTKLNQEHSFLMNVAAVHPEHLKRYRLDIAEHSLVPFFDIIPTLKLDDPAPTQNQQENVKTMGWRRRLRRRLGALKRALLRRQTS
jgi:FkbM family methyltransferase